jgi:hypothetical protein
MSEQQEEVLCNMCGESCCPNEEVPSGTWRSDTPHGLIRANVTGGYDSYHLFDLTEYIFSFCEKCLRKLFIQCAIKPKIHYVLADGNPFEKGSWEKDIEAYEYRVWRDDGGHHQAYLNKFCNRKKNCSNRAIYTVLISSDFSEECVCEEHKDSWGHVINAELVPFISNGLKAFL